ncbi:FAD-dependent oxidoreductase [Candidatus Bathyarchaeota archaeon]|nr:FAD-dependent oxidoreductase [Candidatus Bathyarchaeota archaeon]
MEKPVLVIGGGVAGIQAALDLADRGLQVHLVEKSPSIGGVMAQLDKTFPTMDCSICILAPKMIECSRHPNIEIHTLSEVTGLEGQEGNFKVNLWKEPRYVDASKCTGCGLCAEKCPTKVKDEWQEGLTERKAIYMMFPQAVPLIACIDKENCLYFQKGICQVCSKLCPAGAIDYEQQPQELELNVSSIILATGFEEFDPSELGEYGYSRYEDVITSMEFERLVCASGPTHGHLNRPSDGKLAKRIAFVQCVGSRSHQKGYPFCSSVCCMYATKEAVLIKEHDPESEVSIFYLDLKVFGQGFQDFVNRAKSHYGVEYIRGRPGEIRRNPLNGNLTLWYEDTRTGKVSEKEFDLVVLCTTMISRPENQELAETLGLKLNEWGFFKSKDSVDNPIETEKSGIFICGCCHGPRDIPESVAEASGAAASAAEVARRTINE